MTYKLLIVDDEMPNIRLLERLFQHDYQCLTASSGEEAISLLDQHEVAVIISDQRMPQMTGIELLKQSADRRPHMVRILLTGYTDYEALVEAVNCGLVYMYVSKPWNNDDLKLRVSRAVEAYETNKRKHLLNADNERLTSRMREMRVGLVRAMANILQMSDAYLCLHAVRVSRFSTLLGEKLGLRAQQLSDLMAASFLHDLGAMGRNGEIYSVQCNPLIPEQHAAQAAEIISCISELKETADIVRYHYENFDGSGAPLGLIGDQIPLAARILRVAKEFDLLINPRNEESALTHEAAVERFNRGAGREFDPVVVETFGEVASEMRALIPAELHKMPLHRQIVHIQ
ncbi:MAG TPA: HD domain-containing phosphohydrolase [Pyrinomonadaceae bacterium]|nr:HD domain-containing phosphohydrolase [Pyrinomonadaceae bacterium]